MKKATLKVHTENILPIIKKWLYSEKDIFIRELVSNACDALHKCRVLRDQGIASILDEELKIEITIDKEKKQLLIADTGIGMTAEEVEKYIAQVAFSGAEEFVGKYQSHNEKDQIIGHFGLGFYSAYMAAKQVSIQTKSYQEDAEAVYWSCDGSTEYLIEKGSREQRGTEIVLDIEPESEEFLEESKLRSVLQHYCSFLPFPIYLNGQHMNSKEPLWLKPASQCTKEEYLEFYRSLYPMDPDPIFWIHLNVDYPFHLKGILYFPKIHKKYDWTQSNIKLFCNRVFVSESCKDLIPDYLMALKGAIDSPDIPLNVSRSYLQMDRTVRQLSTHVSKKVADRLLSLYSTEKETFLEHWPDIELIIKLGILQDEKFYEKAKDFLVWKNTKQEWLTLEEYLSRHQEAYKGKVFYTSDEKHASFLSLYEQKGIEVLCSSSPVDSPVMNYLEEKHSQVKFQRVDGDIDELILDKTREKTLLDADGKSEAAKIADCIRSQLDKEIDVEAKSLASDSLPGFVMISEDLRRLRETMALSQQMMPPSLFGKRTFVVNTNHKVISSLPILSQKDPELAKDLVLQVYELSLLSQKELDPAQLSGFISRSNRVLEKLTETLA